MMSCTPLGMQFSLLSVTALLYEGYCFYLSPSRLVIYLDQVEIGYGSIKNDFVCLDLIDSCSSTSLVTVIKHVNSETWHA